MDFYIKRGDKVQGPLSRGQVLQAVEKKKLKRSDLIGHSPDGPFWTMEVAWQSIKTPPAEIAREANKGSNPTEKPSMAIDDSQQNLPQSTTPSPAQNTKKCEYCAEDIRIEAIKCKFCGEMLDRDFSAESGDNASTGSQVAMLEQQAQAQIRAKNFKLAEDTFQQVINLDMSNIRAWLGKAKAIAHQTYFGSPDSLLKHFRIEDRSEEALMCIQLAQEHSGSVTHTAEIEKAKVDCIEICVAELLKGSKSVADTCLGSANIRHNPFAAGLKKGFLSKPLQALTRCLELSPNHPEALIYYNRVCAELANSGAHSLAISSLTLGILSLTIGWCCWLNVPLGLAAVVTGGYGLRDASRGRGGKGMSVAGLAMGILSLIFWTAIAVWGIVALQSI